MDFSFLPSLASSVWSPECCQRACCAEGRWPTTSITGVFRSSNTQTRGPLSPLIVVLNILGRKFRTESLTRNPSLFSLSLQRTGLWHFKTLGLQMLCSSRWESICIQGLLTGPREVTGKRSNLQLCAWVPDYIIFLRSNICKIISIFLQVDNFLSLEDLDMEEESEPQMNKGMCSLSFSYCVTAF